MLPKPGQFSNASGMVDKEGRAPVRELRVISNSNEIITQESALTVDGVIAIISLISQDSAGLPLVMYGRRGRNRYRAYTHPYYTLMHDAPNDEQTSMIFRELIGGHLIGWGNFFGQLIPDNTGEVKSVWPLHPGRMTVARVNGEKLYEYRSRDGKPKIFKKDEILHIPGFGFDGLIGYSRIALARNAIGASMAAEKFGSKLFANDTTLGVAYKHPRTLSEGAHKNLKADLAENHTGSDNAFKPIILEDGLDVARIGINSEEAQFIESRKFSLAEINRILGPLPPHMLGDVEKSTSWGTGIDSQEQGYVNHTLRAYTIRIEQALWLSLLLQRDRDAGYYFEHLFDGLLRGDIQTRYEAYGKAIERGIWSPNEVRSKENANGYPGGDTHYRNAALTPIEGGNASEPANATLRLWNDVIQRVVTREVNDVTGAAHRFLKKNQPGSFAEWADDFYTKDQPAFIEKNFTPLLETMSEIFGGHYAEPVKTFVESYLATQRESLENPNVDAIEATAEQWRVTNTARLLFGIQNLIKEVSYETYLYE
jgi:HK97 family phage portal protein